MTEEKRDIELIDDLIRTARDDVPEVSPELTNRVLSDALALQPQPMPRGSSAGRGFSGVFRAIGGWPAFAGMAAATLAGVWIGISGPAGISELAENLFFDGTVVFGTDYTEFDAFVAEG